MNRKQAKELFKFGRISTFQAMSSEVVAYPCWSLNIIEANGHHSPLETFAGDEKIFTKLEPLIKEVNHITGLVSDVLIVPREMK